MATKQPAITELKIPPAATGATWDQSSFYAFQARRMPSMVVEDARRLRRIFQESASPTFQKMVSWALENDVVFFIDHTLQRAGAYYTMGTGAVGLNAKYADSPMQAAPLIGHEIRHAWQDRQGFIPTAGRNFAEYFMQISLMEADAFAFEKLIAEEESAYWGMNGNRDATVSEEAGLAADDPVRHPQKVLQQAFTAWTGRRGALYGDTAARYFGAQLGIPGITQTDFRMSFQPYRHADKPVIRGIDVADVQKALAAGGSFDGRDNYLDTPVMRDYLEKKLLKSALAQKFYRAGNNLPPLVKEVNKRFRAAQVAHRKKTGNDLYL